MKTFAIFWYRGLALIAVANGLWMLVDPATWFVHIPAGVTDTGPLNNHFVHDIGVVFVIVGVASWWCAANLTRAWPVHLGITAFLVGHALVHVAEISFGLLPAAHWWIDAPLTFAPALVLGVMSLPPVWRQISGPNS